MQLINKSKEKFIKASIKERLTLYYNRFPGTDRYEFTEIDDFDKFDVIFNSGSTKYVGEVKIRDIESTRFPTYILEYQKLYSLFSLACEINATPVYINYFNDGIATIHRLTDLNLFKTTLVACPKKTKTSGKKEYIEKKVLVIPAEKGKRYRYNVISEKKVEDFFKKRFEIKK